MKGQEKEVDDPLLNVAGLKDSSLDEVMLNNKLLTVIASKQFIKAK